MNRIRRICVYCGSSDKVAADYLQAAAQLGQLLAEKKIGLVFGGGKTGMMGAVADAMAVNGAETIGIIPEMFNIPALVHAGLTELRVVDTMHTRKARMAEIADAFIALPGGFGTFEELFEIITWSQIGLHQQPVGILNVNGYYDPMMKMIEHAQREGFIYEEHCALIVQDSTPTGLVDKLFDYQQPEGLSRWVDRDSEQVN